MGEVIFYEGRTVAANGLKKAAFPLEEKVKKYLFSQEFQNLSLLKRIPAIPLAKQKPVLFYPGCGVDILFPLIYLENLFPEVKTAYFVFNDLDNNLNMIKTILDDIGVSFEEKKNAIRFYWKERLVTLTFIQGSVFEMLDRIADYDIYFERAFRIMKNQHTEYEQSIYDHLPLQGVIISDSGFQQFPLEKISVDQGLSAYGEMIVGRKK